MSDGRAGMVIGKDKMPKWMNERYPLRSALISRAEDSSFRRAGSYAPPRAALPPIFPSRCQFG